MSSTACSDQVRVGPAGLHARPAAALVSLSRRFDSTITLIVPTPGSSVVDRSIDTSSVIELLAARLGPGDPVVVTACGPDAAAAVAAAVELVQADPASWSTEARPVGELVGPVAILRPVPPAGPAPDPIDPVIERRRLLDAVARVRSRLVTDHPAAHRGGPAAILAAVRSILDDEGFVGAALARIDDHGDGAEAAVASVIDDLVGRLGPRADVAGLGEQVRSELLGLEPVTLDGLARPSIVVAGPLAPATLLTAPDGMVLAVVVDGPADDSHLAIVARSLGIPLFDGHRTVPPLDTLDLVDGDRVAIDSATGRIRRVHP